MPLVKPILLHIDNQHCRPTSETHAFTYPKASILLFGFPFRIAHQEPPYDGVT